MKPLPMKKALKKENSLGEVGFGKHILHLYKGVGNESEFYYLTDKNNPDKIYMMVSRELLHSMFDMIFDEPTILNQ